MATATYRFIVPGRYIGQTVTVFDQATNAQVASGAVGADGVYSVALTQGDYYATTPDGRYIDADSQGAPSSDAANAAQAAQAATYAIRKPGPNVVLADGSVLHYDDTTRPVYPNSTISFWGHSLIYSDGGTFPNKVAGLLGVPVTNQGVGGSTSTDHAIRKGGIVPLVTLSGNTLPADTSSVAATVLPGGDYLFDASAVNPTFVYTGTLASVPVKLTWTITTGLWSVARVTAAGGTTPIPAGTPFLITSDTKPADVSVFMAARNNMYANNTQFATVVRDVEAMVGSLTPYLPRYVVLSDLTTLAETSDATGAAATSRSKILASNQALSARFGPNYYDIRKDLIAQGLAIAGITPTTADSAAIAKDTMPPSLLAADSAHPNTAGYNAMGTLLANWLVAKGWGTIVAGPQNLLSLNQASIETDATAWTANGDAAIGRARVTTPVLHGSGALQVTAAPSGMSNTILNFGIPVTAGKFYAATIAGRSAVTTRSRYVSYYWYNSSNGFLSFTQGASLSDTATGWTTHTMAGTVAPAGAAFLKIGLESSGGEASGEVHYLDCAGLYEVAGAGVACPTWTAP